jgi:molecular chaperone Hsp33
MDRLKKTMSQNGEALIYAIDASDTVTQSMQRLGSFPPATVHLGQAMMAALLLQAMGADKEGTAETVGLEWLTDGPFGHLYAEARNYGQVRGTLGQPQAPVFEYGQSLGSGQLRVRRSRTTSTTGLVGATGAVVLDVLSYLDHSEQRHCGVNLSVVVTWADPNDPDKGFKVDRAIGYLIDILPQDDEQTFKDALVRWDRRMHEIPAMSKWSLNENDRCSGILQLISGEPAPKITLDQRVEFSCKCSEDRAERAVTLLKSHDTADGVQPQAMHEVKCEYCGRVYQISD